VSSEWDEYAEGWDSNEDVILYSDNAFESLRTLARLDGMDVLDFGCGTGLLTEKLAQVAARVVGLDTSTEMLEVLEAKGLPNVSTIADELTDDLVSRNAGLQSGFDLIVASSVCGFLPDYEKTLRLLKSLLVEGGVFVQWDWLASDEDSQHGLTSEQVSRTLRRVGFDSVMVAVPFSLQNPEGEQRVMMGVGRSA
jgi:predicted TPR repeat methyltransferase